MLPSERTGKSDRPCGKSNRDVLNGALWIGHTGAQWKDFSTRYGAESTVHERFKLWKDKGILEAIFGELSKDCGMQDLSFDSTCCKVHQHAAGAKKVAEELELSADKMIEKQDIGLPRGGKSTKTHAIVDGLGNPIRLIFTGGEAHEFL